jgi:hypothetical protein
MTPEVAEVFELLEFHNILESYRTVEAAVEKFDRNRIHHGAKAGRTGLGRTDVTGTNDGGGVTGEPGDIAAAPHADGAGAKTYSSADAGLTSRPPTVLLAEAPETASRGTLRGRTRSEEAQAGGSTPENKASTH